MALHTHLFSTSFLSSWSKMLCWTCLFSSSFSNSSSTTFQTITQFKSSKTTLVCFWKFGLTLRVFNTSVWKSEKRISINFSKLCHFQSGFLKTRQRQKWKKLWSRWEFVVMMATFTTMNFYIGACADAMEISSLTRECILLN